MNNSPFRADCLPNVWYTETVFRLQKNALPLLFLAASPGQEWKGEVLTMMRKSILLLAIILFGTIALAEPEAFFDNAQINDMIGENYAQVLGQGDGSLVPQSNHISAR